MKGGVSREAWARKKNGNKFGTAALENLIGANKRIVEVQTEVGNH